MDDVEVRAPALAAFVVRWLVRLPMPLRRPVLVSAFDRAEHAFNRKDFEAVTALWAKDVEYVPPSALYVGEPIRGRQAVVRFWQEVTDRFEESTITNLSIEETTPERFVRTARLSHRGDGRSLDYEIRQTTQLSAGRVIRQVNEGAGGNLGH